MINDYAEKKHLRLAPSFNLRRLWLRLRIWFLEHDIDNLDHLIQRINYERSEALHERGESELALRGLRKQL